MKPTAAAPIWPFTPNTAPAHRTMADILKSEPRASDIARELTSWEGLILLRIPADEWTYAWCIAPYGSDGRAIMPVLRRFEGLIDSYKDTEVGLRMYRLNGYGQAVVRCLQTDGE